MENKRDLVYLAALLHDIGKFYQRADSGFSDKQVQLTDYSKKLANDICPLNDKGKFGYQHVVLD
jgi:CRISPR-associated protein Csm1